MRVALDESTTFSDAQADRLVTGEPHRIPSRTFAARCDLFDCAPNDLFEPYVEMQADKTANAPRPSDLGVTPGNSPNAARRRDRSVAPAQRPPSPNRHQFVTVTKWSDPLRCLNWLLHSFFRSLCHQSLA